MVEIQQGDIFWAEAESKRRPVLVITRSEAIAVLRWILIAPVTKTIRSIPTEIYLDKNNGLPHECVANFDNIQPINKSFLTQRIGSLDQPNFKICKTLSALADC